VRVVTHIVGQWREEGNKKFAEEGQTEGSAKGQDKDGVRRIAGIVVGQGQGGGR